MSVFILLFAFLLCFLICSQKYNWRESFVNTLLLLSFFIYLTTELLGYFKQITSSSLIITWGSISAVGIFLLRKGFNRPQIFALLKLTKINPFFVYLLCFIIASLFLESIFSPPNNYDSMSYHLARVSHWIQYQNVSYYPTSIARQLYHNPFAEYVILQLQLLSGGDWLANSVQFVAMVGSLIVVSLMAKQLGLDAKGQLFAVIIAITVPVGVFQSTTTQNDYVVTFFLLSFIYWGYQLVKTWSLQTLLWLTISLSMGALTKYTTLVFAFPFCIWFGIKYIRLYGFGRTILIVTFLGLFLVTLLTPLVYRNLKTFGNPIGPQAGTSLNLPMANAPINAINTYSNIIRNIGNQVGLPLSTYNKYIDKTIYSLHKIAHIEVNERNNSYLNDQYHTSFSFDEDLASSPLHLLLIGLAFLWFMIRLKAASSEHKNAFIILLCTSIGFVLFSALLRWQSTSGRLLLPLFITASIPTSFYIIRVWSGRWQQVLLGLLLVICLPIVFFNKSKPVIVLDNWVRHWLHQPQQIIPEMKYESLLKTLPSQSEFLNKSYEKPYLTHYFQLKKEVSLADKKRLVWLLDSLHFMEKKPFWASPRVENYFRNRRGLYEPFNELTNQIQRSGCKNIGFDLGFDGMEYPLWVLLNYKTNGLSRINYIRYSPILAHTPNVPNNFGYDCLVTEFEDSIKDYDAQQIKTYLDYGEIKLIIFKKPQHQLFVRERFFFDPSYL